MTTTSAQQASMDRLINQVDRLHSAPHVACQVLNLLQDEEFDMDQLVSCLEWDPALATSVLRLVNSSYFGLARNVSSLQQAVTFLGCRTLRLAVLSFGLMKQMIGDTPAEVYRDFLRRSLTMAATASQLAVHREDVQRDEAYCAGLLADVGVLVLAQLETSSYSRMYAKLGHTALLTESELELYGFHHGQLGAHLLQRWNLPDRLTRAVSLHHSRPQGDDDLRLTVYAGDLMADALWTPESPRVAESRKLLQAEFGLDLDGYIELAVECKRVIAENAELHKVELDGNIDCDALLAQARKQYMEEALEAAMDWDSFESVANQDVS
jgi:HD-like signal output (HDOD) protein